MSKEKTVRNKYMTVAEVKASGKPRGAIAPSIYYKPATNNYIIECFHGYDENGKAIRKHKTFSRFEDAEKALIRHKASMLEKSNYENVTTLCECIKTYIHTQRSLEQIAPTTAEGYENLLKRISTHPISKKLIKELKLYDITEYMNDLRRSELYSNSTINKDVALIRASLWFAESQSLIEHNPISGKIALLPKERPNIVTVPAVTVGKICDAILAEDKWTLAVAFCLCAYQGLRRGECAGLRWDMISFYDNTIAIVETRTRVNSHVCKQPKTKSSIRKVYMHSRVREILLQYRERLISSKKIHEYVLVTEKTGNPASVGHLSEYFTVFIRKHPEFPHVTLHGLRHTYATEAIKHGADITSVSKAIGHSTISTTVNVRNPHTNKIQVKAA